MFEYACILTTPNTIQLNLFDLWNQIVSENYNLLILNLISLVTMLEIHYAKLPSVFGVNEKQKTGQSNKNMLNVTTLVIGITLHPATTSQARRS